MNDVPGGWIPSAGHYICTGFVFIRPAVCAARLLLESPLKALHVHASVVAEADALPFQKHSLLHPAGNSSPCMVDHTVTGVIAVAFRLREDFPDLPRVFLPPEQARDLSIGRHEATMSSTASAESFSISAASPIKSSALILPQRSADVHSSPSLRIRKCFLKNSAASARGVSRCRS